MIIELTIKNSIQEAINNCQEGDIILLNDGIYKEKIEIWKNNVILQAKNKNKAIITNQDYYHKIMPDHNECNTFNTFTVLVGGDNITLQDIVIENASVPSDIYGQAVALHVLGTHFHCTSCIIKSAQDTLFTGPLPKDLLIRYQGFYDKKRLSSHPSLQEYKNCTIIGDVDYIFGCATALFENCILKSLPQEKNKFGFICAPAHEKDTPYGYLFYHCKLEGSSPSFLARPWRDYGSAAFIECELGSHIIPSGYHKWDGTQRDKTARFYEFTPNHDTSKRVSWSHQLTANEAQCFVLNFKKILS